MNGADMVAYCLREHGVSIVSTLCGNGIDPVLYAARQAGIRVVDTHNEQTAAFMADSYGRLTRRVGVCAVSSAVGFTNALIGVLNARFDGSPMLLIAGASDHASAGRGNFQDFEQAQAAASYFKFSRLVDKAENIPAAVHAAISAAVSGRPGPAHLTIPLDVLASEAGAPPARLAKGEGYVNISGNADPGAIDMLAQAIARAERPLLVAGSGVFYADGAAALVDLVTRSGMPVVTPIWDRGSIHDAIPHFLGVIGSASGSPPVLAQADLIILAGARVDYRVGYMQPPAIAATARTARISSDGEELRQGIEPDIAIHASPAAAFRALCGLLPSAATANKQPWLEAAQKLTEQFRRPWSGPVDMSQQPMNGRHIVEALRPFVGGDSIFLIDGGNIGQWAHMALSSRYPDSWLTCGASGVIGFGIGGAMAAKLAYPDRSVILLSGDGSMGFNTADFESAVRQRLPFVAIVADDQAWGIVVSGQMKRWGADKMVAAQLGPLRFDLMAEACGAIGVRAENAASLGAAIERGLAADRPMLIHTPIRQGGPADARVQ